MKIKSVRMRTFAPFSDGGEWCVMAFLTPCDLPEGLPFQFRDEIPCVGRGATYALAMVELSVEICRATV